jgi:uncharacterized protein (TIGR03437 family)
MTIPRRLSFFLTLFIFLTAAAPLASAQTPTLDAEELAFVTLINNYRAQNGLGALKVSIAMTNASEWMSADMGQKNYFSHTDSLGRDPFSRMAAFGYAYNAWKGENIAAGYADAANTFNQWKNSPGHNQNMLSPNYTVIGIARAYNGSSTYRWYWTNNFGGYVDATLSTGGTPPPSLGPVTAVNAANYGAALAPGSIAAAFGSGLATGVYAATALPLQTALGGTVVTVNGVAAQLFYASPTQVNFIVPPSTAPGAAALSVTVNGAAAAGGTLSVAAVAPALFTAAADGKGVPAGFSTFDGVNLQLLSNPDGSPRAIGAGTDASPNYLVLYGTGFRLRTSLGAVQVTVAGLPAQVQFAGAHPNYAGLDQLNLKLPTSLGGRGNVEVVVTVDGRQANKVTINVM